MKDDHDQTAQNTSMAHLGLTLAAVGFILFSDYNARALGFIVGIFFAAYIWMRVMVFLDNDRFSPKRLRVGITWALIGIDADTDEFDPRPVVVYFALLAVLFAGLVVKPILQMMFG